MTDVETVGKVKRAWVEATVVRADGTRVPLGVVADSSRRWRYGPGRLVAALRTRNANRQVR